METVAGWMRRGAAAILRMGLVPRHVAFIMDGNRRFAERLQIEAFRGHSRGYDKVCMHCMQLPTAGALTSPKHGFCNMNAQLFILIVLKYCKEIMACATRCCI
jgi:undecaprenyl pyrophosphate synthase